MSAQKPLRPHPNTPKGTLLHPEFVYTPAAHSNIEKTFARVRLELALKKKRDEELRL
jgi:hypothetical protein